MSAMENGSMRMSTSSLDDISSGQPCSHSEECERPPVQAEVPEALIDPHCDPNNPQRISFHDVTSAAFLIKDDVERTPCPVGTFSNTRLFIRDRLK